MLSPVHQMIAIRLTNRQSVRSMIETYTVEIQTGNGDWIKLIRIDGTRGELYFITKGNPKEAKLVQIAKLDSVLYARTIDPGETVEGVAFFELPKSVEEDNPPLRVYVKDFGGAEMTQIIPSQPQSDFAQGWTMKNL